MKNLEEIRMEQASRLHREIWRGHPKQKPAFAEYVKTIPRLLPATGGSRLFTIPVLVDGRVSLPRCYIQFRVDRKSPHPIFVDYQGILVPKVYWIWCNDGKHLYDTSPREYRKSFGENVIGLSEREGLAFHAQYPSVARNRFIDLPGSVLVEDDTSVACIGPWTGYKGGKVWLHYINEEERHPRCRSASRILARIQTEG